MRHALFWFFAPVVIAGVIAGICGICMLVW